MNSLIFTVTSTFVKWTMLSETYAKHFKVQTTLADCSVYIK